MVILVAAAQALEDRDRLLDRRLLNHHLLQPPREGAILLDLLELLEGRRADHADVARAQHRLDQRGEIHRAAGRRPGADSAVHLVDEQDRLGALGQGVHDGLEALFEVTTEPRPGEQRRRVERKDLGVLQDRRHVVLQQALRETLGEGGLADARFADEHRVVLAPPAEDLHRPLHLGGAADQRVEDAVAGFLRQVDGVGVERRFARWTSLRHPARRRLAGRRTPGSSGAGTFEMPWLM